jgi:hypothetical protein
MPTQKPSSIEGLSPVLVSALDEYLLRVRVQIADDAYAYSLARQSQAPEGEASEGHVQASLKDLSRAMDHFTGSDQPPLRASKVDRFFEFFPPFTCICALLSLAFAVLGLWALRGGDAKAAIAAGFLDIAKIFAGAIVGSSASKLISASKNRRP